MMRREDAAMLDTPLPFFDAAAAVFAAPFHGAAAAIELRRAADITPPLYAGHKDEPCFR